MSKKIANKTTEGNILTVKGLEDTKFVLLIRSFSKEEMNEFSRFLDSPYCNRKGPYIVKAFKEIRKYYPGFNSNGFKKENIFKALYPGKEYNDVLLRKIFSELQKLAGEFLSAPAFGEFSVTKELKLLSNYRLRRVDKLFEKKYREVSDYLEDPTGKVNKDYFRNRYDMEIEAVNYELMKDRQEKTFEGLKKIQQHITYDFLINMLDIQYNLLVGGVTNFKHEYNFITEILKYIDFSELKKFLKKNSAGQYPIFEIFYYRYLSYLDDSDDEHFYKFRDLALKHLEYFNREEKYTMLIALQNNAIRKFRKGEKDFQKEVFYVYRVMLEKDLYAPSENEYLQISTFRNIFITALNLGEHKWAESFVEKYISRVDPEKRESIYHHSRALLKFTLKKYDDALEELQKHKYEHFMHKIDVQHLTLKIYYETEAYEPALSLIDNLKHYYRDNQKIAGSYGKTNVPFLNFLQRMILIKSGGKRDDKDELIRLIQKTNVVDKKWLTDKANAL